MHGNTTRLMTLLVLSLILSACQTDSFYVENANLSELQSHRAMQAVVVQGARPSAVKDYFGLSGHRIVPGVGTVLAYRAFSGGLIPLVDQGGFEKLTVVLPVNFSKNVGENISLSEGGEVIVFWSRGPSNFPRTANCYGYASSGSIAITNTARDTIAADLDMLCIRSAQPGGRNSVELFLSKRLSPSIERLSRN